jgi:hypothetical protein
MKKINRKAVSVRNEAGAKSASDTLTAPSHLKAAPQRNPTERRLRAFAYDPSLATELQNYDISEVLVRVRWEPDRDWAEGKDPMRLHHEPGLLPGPIGDYIEVVDVDPASGCVYAPVDLNTPALLAQDGLAPSEGNPQFHQQMVYAVAMSTIQNFERALGRRVLWSERQVLPKNGKPYERVAIQRLRIYPHALRQENAYYDPDKKALLFGYFPARPAANQDGLPGGVVFSCLSQDIVAHETTHAILDGMQSYYLEPTNLDSLAFHEAFSDIVALFQHFSYPEILRNQLARAGGDMDGETLLGQLAVQFGKSTGKRGALRSAIGGKDPVTGQWTLIKPAPDAYAAVKEPHTRGSLLVGAVFDAFRAIYRHRTRDLLRIATGGTGVLPQGDLHPDLVARLANEAAKTAQHLLLICIRALDYCPPVDITFGDYLRALITADYDLVPSDTRHYRVALIEAFRSRGIYPQDVRTLSEESLRWQPPAEARLVTDFCGLLRTVFFSSRLGRLWDEILHCRYVPEDDSQPIRHLTRMEVAQRLRQYRAIFHGQLQRVARELAQRKVFSKDPNPFGFNFRYGHEQDLKFEVHQIRPVRRQGPDGRASEDLLIQITQRRPGYFDPERQKQEDQRYFKIGQTTPPEAAPDFWFRGGATFILDLNTFVVRYGVVKNVLSSNRLSRQSEFQGGSQKASLQELYFGPASPAQRLAGLHHDED